MKPEKSGKTLSDKAPQHRTPDVPAQQAIAEKSANSSASVKARIESQNMPDKPAMTHQNQPNSSGRK